MLGSKKGGRFGQRDSLRRYWSSDCFIRCGKVRYWHFKARYKAAHGIMGGMGNGQSGLYHCRVR